MLLTNSHRILPSYIYTNNTVQYGAHAALCSIRIHISINRWQDRSKFKNKQEQRIYNILKRQTAERPLMCGLRNAADFFGVGSLSLPLDFARSLEDGCNIVDSALVEGFKG